MKVLITGGAGFIGANFVYHMIETYPDYDIVVLDLLTYAGNLETLDKALKHKKLIFVKSDITDRESMFSLFEKEKFDVVVNFAAESHVDRSILDPSIFLKTNILGTQVLMDASLKYGVQRFHQVSTDEVYGDLPLDKPGLFFTEETPLHTSSPYSASKASADLLVMAYYRTFKLPISISRCSNNYGPYQFPEKLIPLVISRALNNDDIPVYGNGLNVRDWLHVKDHCIAIDKIIHNAKIGSIYNVGGHNEKNNIYIVKTILSVLGKSHDLIKYVDDRKGHDLRYAIDSELIKKDLGWQPSIMFDEGIVQTINWYLENKPWWERIISGDYKNYYEKIYG